MKLNKNVLIINRLNKIKFIEVAYKINGNLSKTKIDSAKLDFHRVFYGWYNGLVENDFNCIFIDNISYIIPSILAQICPKIYLFLLKVQNTKKIKLNILNLIDKLVFTLHMAHLLIKNKPKYIIFPYDTLNRALITIAKINKCKTISFFGVVPKLKTERVKNIVLCYDNIISGYNLPELWPEIKMKFQKIYIGPSYKSNYTNYPEQKKNIDITIVGGFGGDIFHKRAEIIERLIPNLEQNNIIYKICGYKRGDDFSKRYPILNDRLDEPIYGEKFYELIKSTNIWINIPSDQHISINATRPQGILEIAASKTFQLVYNTKEASEMFNPQNEIILFNDPKDLFEKIVYFLEKKSEANSIALNAYNKFVTSYSGEIQILKVLRKIDE